MTTNQQTVLFSLTDGDRGANLSGCTNYRYTLWRIWDKALPLAMIIGLNPSTADANTDDPTIRRCISFMKGFGYGGFYMVNLFAFRATEPAVMKKADFPVGHPFNDEYLKLTTNKVAIVIFAWGTDGHYLNRDREVIAMFPNAYCFGKTKEGHPKHPLYLASDTLLTPFTALT